MKKFDTDTPLSIIALMTSVDVLFNNEDLFEIKTQADYDYAVELISSMKGDVKKVEAAKKELTQPLHECKSEIIGRFTPFLERCDGIETKFKSGMSDFLLEQRRKEQEAQAAADEKARNEREALERRAQKAADKGKVEKAEDLVVQANAVSSIGAVDAAPKTKGTSQTDAYEVRLVSKKEFIQGVAAGLIPMNTLDINETALKKHIKANDGEVEYPGVDITAKIQIGIKAAS